MGGRQQSLPEQAVKTSHCQLQMGEENFVSNELVSIE